MYSYGFLFCINNYFEISIMKLTEKLSFAKDTLVLTKTLEKEIYQKLEHHTGSGDDFVYDELSTILQSTFANYKNNIGLTNVNIDVVGGDGGAEYEYETKTITITVSHDDISVISELIDEYSEDYYELKTNEEFIEAINYLTRQFCALFLHEAQHALQDYQSNYNSTAYRSYTNKNKSNFYDKINNGILDIDYYSSPEEIDAHAVQRISDVISQMKDFDSEEQRRYLTNCFQTIAALGKKYITTTMAGTNQIAIKSRNRYMKKIYIGLKDYLDNHITD